MSILYGFKLSQVAQLLNVDVSRMTPSDKLISIFACYRNASCGLRTYIIFHIDFFIISRLPYLESAIIRYRNSLFFVYFYDLINATFMSINSRNLLYMYTFFLEMRNWQKLVDDWIVFLKISDTHFFIEFCQEEI